MGWHAHARLHAENCQAFFTNKPPLFEIEALDRAAFNNHEKLLNSVRNADVILHFAGVNRGTDTEVETGNPLLAHMIIDACEKTNSTPHIVYANSIHAYNESVYGNSKRAAGEMLEAAFMRYTNLVLPHIFGECARPFYNNVTATLIHQILADDTVELNPEGKVSLLHSGEAAKQAIKAALEGATGILRPEGNEMSVVQLYKKLENYHSFYTNNTFPDLSDNFDVALFNTYRAATYPDSWPRKLKLNTDPRGTLFEAGKMTSGGQCFLSTTEVGVTRGDHFHLNKVERFLVVQGEAVIRIRRVLDNKIWEYHVKGETPSPVDMPTLHTHSIENIGTSPLLTLFWTHDHFDPSSPDTFYDEVLK